MLVSTHTSRYNYSLFIPVNPHRLTLSTRSLVPDLHLSRSPSIASPFKSRLQQRPVHDKHVVEKNVILRPQDTHTNPGSDRPLFQPHQDTMTGSGGTLSQLEALFVQLPEHDSSELDPPEWYVNTLFDIAR